MLSSQALHFRRTAYALLLLAMYAQACDRDDGSGRDTLEARAKAQGPEQRAANLYRGLCATCHGLDGSASGPAAASLNPKPRSFADQSWQASVSDAQIKAIIVQGGQALGKSPAMPPVAALGEEPRELEAMVRLVRAFGSQAPNAPTSVP